MQKINIETNRTGVTVNPGMINEQSEFAQSIPAGSPPQGTESIQALRAISIKEAAPVGSIPEPLSAESIMGRSIDASGQKARVFGDKLGQRLAFERSGVRLYEALIDKALAVEFNQKNELVADLNHIHAEEKAHFLMLHSVMEDLGADSTAMTPGAAVSGVTGQGFMQAITDPRTSLSQCLEAILGLELIDNSCWEHLIDAAKEAEVEGIIEIFTQASQEEKEHVQIVEKWLKATLYA